MRKNQQGFGLIEWLIILFIILLLIFLGWWVWNNNQGNEPADSQQASSSEQEADADAQPADKYLEVKEWGVRFKLNDDAQNAFYKMRNDGNYVDIYNSDFEGLKNSKGTACTDSLLMVAGRYTGANDPNLTDDPSANKELITVGNYGYSGTPANQSYPACVYLNPDVNNDDLDQTVLAAFNKYKNGLKDSFKTLEATP